VRLVFLLAVQHYSRFITSCYNKLELLLGHSFLTIIMKVTLYLLSFLGLALSVASAPIAEPEARNRVHIAHKVSPKVDPQPAHVPIPVNEKIPHIPQVI
jgi:hypothetical protein